MYSEVQLKIHPWYGAPRNRLRVLGKEMPQTLKSFVIGMLLVLVRDGLIWS